MKFLFGVIVLTILSLLPASPLRPQTAQASELSPRQRVLQLVNEHRAAAGCGPLTMQYNLKSAALGHANDMANNNFVSHTGSNGSTMVSRVEATGYNWMMLGENIAAGQPTPRAVVDAWMNSPGHRANILNCSFHEIGIAYVYHAGDTYPTASSPYQYYWVQVFGTRLP